jgi:2,3-bisphosphoglycerate-dependent phosphoglycerate mutase
MTRLVLVRHGESNATVEQRIGGSLTCTGLSPLGRKQAEALAERLRRTGEICADVLVSSTMPRARETAEVLAPALGDLRIELDDGVREHEPGEQVDGMTFHAFVERFGHTDWASDPYHAGFPGGETLAEFQHRVASALHRLARTHTGKTVVIACHGGVIDVAMRTFLRTPMTGGFETWTRNTSLTEFERAEHVWRLHRYNDAAHLAGLPAWSTRD